MNVIYLRKSREDLNNEDTLKKHRSILVELCDKNNWSYTIFEEIGSSDSLDTRTEINKVIELAKEGKVRNVICMDLDRLSRNTYHSTFIQKIFRENNVKIVTPTKTYDLNNDNDILFSELQNVISAQEYRLIKKRMAIGKERGAKEGNLVGGEPPLGYYYDRNDRVVKIDEEKGKIYRWLVDKFLSGEYSTRTLSIEFNKYYVSKRGNKINCSSLHRILTNRFYLGEIKFKGEWYKGKHEPLLTIEEYEQIQNQLKGRRTIPKRQGYKEIKPLTQIVKCGYCGHTLTVTKDKRYGHFLRCWHIDNVTGTRCEQKSTKESIVLEILDNEIRSYMDDLRSAINNGGTEYQDEKIKRLQNEIEDITKSISKLETKKENTILMTQEGILSLSKCKEELDKISKDINMFNENKQLLQKEISSFNKDYEKELIRFEEVYDALKDATSEEFNSLIRTLVNRITLKKEDRYTLEVDIQFI